MVTCFGDQSSTNSDGVFTHVTHVIRNQNGVDITLIAVILYFPLLFWKICGEGEVKVSR